MQTTLTTIEQQRRTLVTPDGRAATQPIPCFQCGVCCMKWQPLLSPGEIRRLAADLGLSSRTFRRRYIRPYPLRRGWGMLTTGATGGCVFLAFAQGRSFCTIYAHRPAVCREWGAGLDKRECVTGLARMGGAGLLTLETLYASAAEREAVTAQVSRMRPAPAGPRGDAARSADGRGPAGAAAAGSTAW